MYSFDFRGLPVAYIRHGQGEPVVFIHNGGTSHAIWAHVLPLLSDRHEVFALDLPGFGASPQPVGGCTLSDHIDLLAAFVDAHQLAPVRLVGNCMGSAIALGLAMRLPQDVAALVLLNPLTDATYSAGRLGSTLWLHKQLPRLAQAIHGGLRRLTLPGLVGEQALAFQFGAGGRAAGLQRTPELGAYFSREGQMDALLGVLEDVPSYGVFDALQPTADFPPRCTIWGLENRVLSAEAGRRLNRTLKPQRAEWLEGCGHLAMLEQPAVVAGIIREFFDAMAK